MIEINHTYTPGFCGMTESDTWKVVFVTPAPVYGPLQEMKRHNDTDEVFVLIRGTATMYTLENDQVVSFPMEKETVYNIRKGTWHHLHLQPDAFLIGEVWEDASNKSAYGVRRRYFVDGELDSVMNYPFRNAIINFIRGWDNGPGLKDTVMTIAENYPPQVFLCNMNLLGTHDTPRILTALVDNYDGPRSELQKVNRVYASTNPNMGTLVKVKPDGTVGKIGGLPDSVIIDNKNKLSLDAVDKSWYIALAKKYISDYVGV